MTNSNNIASIQKRLGYRIPFSPYTILHVGRNFFCSHFEKKLKTDKLIVLVGLLFPLRLSTKFYLPVFQAV